jgi:ribosomal protein L9
MDAVTATLAAFAPTEAAAHSLKKYDAAIKDHVGAVKSLLTNQRQVISANTGEILQVYLTIPVGIQLPNILRILILRLTLSHFKLSCSSH